MYSGTVDCIGAPNGISDNSKAQPYTFLTQLTLYIAKPILPHLPLILLSLAAHL